jgi:DNA-binding transcriptional LysR family regulator
MNIDDVRAFVAVVDSGSVGKAALRLNLTQPAISRRVQRLEESLGVTLLDRISKPARPTRAGEAAYRRCLDILRATDALAREAGTATPTMTLRVGVSYAISECVFAPALDAVHQLSPDLSLQLTANASPPLRKAVSDGALDAAIIIFYPGRTLEGPRATLLGEEHVAVIAGKDTNIPDRAAITDLAAHSWVINPDGCGFRTQLERALADHGAPLKVMAETWGNNLQLAIIARGIGLGLIPERLVHASPYRSHLRIIDVGGFQPKVSVWMVRGDVLPAFDVALDAMAAAVKGVLSGTQVRPRRIASAG